ncbi:MAG: TRAP transporter small permease subunit [Desulfofustis sp.]|nr:TRAP transporter small permease subunit [Desulfofustis sp.]MBT8354379.1 TRAP transporter small permease subunit [Desulfofustis sp.]
MQKTRMLIGWLRAAAEGVVAAMLAAMFLTFVLQIFSRYVINQPIGWTLEVCLTLWLWLVFWGCAFVVSHDEHVTFDVLYKSVRPGTRRVFALLGSAAIVVGLGISLLPTLDFIDFLKIKKSAILKIPMRTVFSIYAIFLISAILVYAWRFISVIRHGLPEEHLEIGEILQESASEDEPEDAAAGRES